MENSQLIPTIPSNRFGNILFLYFLFFLTISLNELPRAIADIDISLHDCSLALSTTCTNSTFSFLSMIECAQQNLEGLPIQCDYLLGSMMSTIFVDCENDLREICYDYDDSSWLDCLMDNTRILSPLCKHQFENYIEVGIPCELEANNYCSENKDLDGMLSCLGAQDPSKINNYCQDTLRGLSQCTSSNYSANHNLSKSNSDLMRPPRTPMHGNDRDGIIDSNPLKPSPGGDENGNLPPLTPDKPPPMTTNKNKERSSNPSKTVPDRGISKSGPSGPATIAKSGARNGELEPISTSLLRKLLVTKVESDVEGMEDSTEYVHDQKSSKKRNKKKYKKMTNKSADPIYNQADRSRHRRLDLNTSSDISKVKIREFARRGGGKLNAKLPTREEWLASRKQWLDGMHKKVERVSTFDTVVKAGGHKHNQRHRRTVSEDMGVTRRRHLQGHIKVNPIHSDLVPLPLDTPCWAIVTNANGDSNGDNLHKEVDETSRGSETIDMDNGGDGEPPLHPYDDIANATGNNEPSSELDDVHKVDPVENEGLISNNQEDIYSEDYNVSADDKQTSTADIMKESDSSPTGSPTARPVISKSTVGETEVTSHDSASTANDDKQRQQEGGDDMRPHSGEEFTTDDEDDYVSIWTGYSDGDSYSGGNVLIMTVGGLLVIGGIVYYVYRVRQRMAGEDHGYRAATAITATWTADDESSSHPLRSSGEVELGENPFH